MEWLNLWRDAGVIGLNLMENGWAQAQRVQSGQRPDWETRNLIWAQTRVALSVLYY
jgi:hypothetical protein